MGKEIGNNNDTLSNDEIPPVVFVNKPITDEGKDIVGFSNQVNTICSAIDSGATMIGIIADYGTGKSTMTSLLSEKIEKEPYKYPRPVQINMWDCLRDDINNESSERKEISDITKTFVYQLAGAKDRKGRFSSFINKRLSRNYGNISLSVGGFKYWWRFLIAALLYIGYAIFSNSSIKAPEFLKIDWIINTARFCRIVSPIFLVAAVAFLIWGIIDTYIVFSHWKTQNTREAETNDVIDAYASVINHIKPSKNSKRIFIIEDLDRIDNKETILGFLKELYRFQNSTKKYSDRFVYIISIKPEYLLKDKRKRSGTKDDNKTIKSLYSKVFDVIIPLKTIHYDDYDSIISSLLNSEPEKKKELEEIIGVPITDSSLPEVFYWIKKGQNLTLRDIKDRLNQAILIYTTRKSYKTKTSVTFEACAAVTYLEVTYPNDFATLVNDEESFSQLMSESVKIFNNHPNKIEAAEDLKKQADIHFPGKFSSSLFVEELCQLINDGIFNYDYRMYFYTYPKNSYIKTTEERRLCDMLLVPSRFSDYNILEDITDAVYEKGDDNIVTETMRKLDYFPEVILHNKTLLKVACEIDFNKTCNAIPNLFFKKEYEESVIFRFLCYLHEVEVNNRTDIIAFISDLICLAFSNSVKNSYWTSINQKERAMLLRKCMVKAFKNDILCFSGAFLASDSAPQISKEEIDTIDDPDVSVRLINKDKLTKENYLYLSELIIKQKLSGQAFEDALSIVREFIKMEPEGYQGFVLEFLTINKLAEFDIFHKVVGNCEKERVCNYINLLGIEKLTSEFYADIDNIGFEEGLSTEVLIGMAEIKLFNSVLLHSSKSNDYSIIDSYLGDKDSILTSCEWVNENLPDSIISIRKHLCIDQNNKDYSNLFHRPYPLITNDEYTAIVDTDTAIDAIEPHSVNLDNYMELVDAIARRNYENDSTIRLFRQMFDPDYQSDCIVKHSDLFASIVTHIDYKSINLRKLDEESRETIYGLINEGFDYAEIEPIEQIRALGCLIPSLEKEISDNDKEYGLLIREINEFTSYTLSWLKDNYIRNSLSKELSDELKRNGDYPNYITTSVLRDGKMIIDNSFSINNYIYVYINVPEMFDIMCDHWEFLESIEKEEYLNMLHKSDEGNRLIYPFDKVHQNEDIISFIFAGYFNEDEKRNYILNIGEFSSDKAAKIFLTKLVRPQNIDLVNSIKGYWHVRNRLPSNMKGYFTKKWKERWEGELGDPTK